MAVSRALVIRLVFGLLLAGHAPAVAAQKDQPDWLPLTAEERNLKDNPARPGDHAMVLYRECITDDSKETHHDYYRIKIFSDEGKRWADIRIPYWKGFYKVERIQARTVQPDGTVIPFTGEIHDLVTAKYKSVKLHAKTFTLPDVRMGSIIEYRYTLHFQYPVPPSWGLQEELFTRRARFRYKPSGTLGLGWTGRLHDGKQPQQAGDWWELELNSVSGFVSEDFTPPEGELKPYVKFYRSTKNPEWFWRDYGERWRLGVDNFIGERKAIRKLAEHVAPPGDPPETRLRKLYARTQLVRHHIQFKESERDRLKENSNVEQMLERGYGSGLDINLLLVALARAAGFEATLVWVSQRDRSWFHKEILEESQLNAHVVWVKAGGKEYYLDPATPFCPFGLLTWEQTSAGGIRLDKDNITFISTPQPAMADAVIQRRATLKISAEGDLEGELAVSFLGQEALSRRLQAIDDDEAGRRKGLEDEIKLLFPASASVELLKVTGWEATGEPLETVFRVRLLGFATPTGRRLMLTSGLLQTENASILKHARRLHPVYFSYPYRREDEFVLELPPGYDLESVPAQRTLTEPYGKYEMSHLKEPGKLRIHRTFAMEGYFFQLDWYANLRNFFEQIRSNDEQQAVLALAKTATQ
jgi:transglutaminase-like putative cysteine protease